MTGRGASEVLRDPARPLGALTLLALGVNGVVGVGIFFVPAELAELAPGRAGVLLFAATALLLVPVALTLSTLGRRFDEDGGPVVYARAAFGELAAFVVGWISFVSAVTSTAAVLSGLIRSLELPGPRAERMAGAFLATLLAALCAAGLSLSARVWTLLTALKLLPLVALVAASLVSTRMPAALPAGKLAPAVLLPAALLATFSYQGFEIVPVVAGQTRASPRAVPFAILGSLGLSAVLYVLLQDACVRALPQLASSTAPLAEAAEVLGGPRLGLAVRAGTTVSAFGITVGMLAMTPRYLSALAASSGLRFSLDALSPGGVPLRSLLVTWVLVMGLVQAGDLGELFAISSAAVLAQYVVVALALLALARRRERGLTPRSAWPAVPTVIIGLLLVSGATRREWLVAAAAVALGALLRKATRARPVAA